MISEQVKALLPDELKKITYIGEFPTDVNQCIAITEVGGPHGTYFNKDQLNEPYLKVQVRSPQYSIGYQLINGCKQILTSYADAQLLSIILIGDINYFGRDDRRRNHWELTFKIFAI